MAIRIEARRFAHRLALLGIQIKNSLPLYFRGDPQKLLLARQDAEEVVIIAKAIAIQHQEEQEWLKEVRARAIRNALITDAIVGAIVAGMARYNSDNQYLFIIGWLAGIQLVLTIYAYYRIKNGLGKFLIAIEIPSQDREAIMDVSLTSFRSAMWFAYPIRIVEFFFFAGMFLVIYWLYVPPFGTVGPVELFSRNVFDFVAASFYGSNLTPQDRLIMTIFGFVLSYAGSWTFQKWLSMQLNLKK